jgi:hypothetical protein
MKTPTTTNAAKLARRERAIREHAIRAAHHAALNAAKRAARKGAAK